MQHHVSVLESNNLLTKMGEDWELRYNSSTQEFTGVVRQYLH
jgi:hypothetical protein